MKYSIGIDIGGTKSAVLLGAFPPKGRVEDMVLRKKSFLMKETENAQAAVQRLKNLLHEILREENPARKDLSGIGISCGGPLDSAGGVILNPPNLPGWENLPIKRIFQEEFHLPVALENDANACALAEWKYGAGCGCRDMVFLTFGTGMGAGLILDGRLYRGACDMAGEIGHVRMERRGPEGFGKAGSFEGFCSGGGISRLAAMKGFPGNPDAKDVFLAARQGNPLALEICRICGRQLGRGLAILTDLLNPECIVIGSIFQRSGQLLWPHAQKTWEEESLAVSLAACRIVPSGLGDAIGDIAALSVAACRFEKEGIAE